ncbi:MAG: methyltransferase domain-containing protein [Chloroflexota bacterium]|nr:methyltransferase domain-containing protein [Chloroflexota bacterium]
MSAADTYAARVDAVLAQRTRLRGPQPPGDLFAGFPPDHPMLRADARRPLEPNLEIIAGYIRPDDVIVDVGGGGGRVSLPLALRCRALINVDPSAAMLRGFEANARQAGISNVQVVHGDWLDVNPPRGSVALVNHVTYLTRDIVPFVEKLEAATTRRVLLTVNSPPPPSRHRVLFRLLYDEAEEVVPGHVELVNVLWEMGIEPDVRMLPDPLPVPPPVPTREAAIQAGVDRFIAQWAFWPLGPELEARLRRVLEARFDELFNPTADGYAATWINPGREVLISWESRR